MTRIFKTNELIVSTEDKPGLLAKVTGTTWIVLSTDTIEKAMNVIP